MIYPGGSKLNFGQRPCIQQHMAIGFFGRTMSKHLHRTQVFTTLHTPVGRCVLSTRAHFAGGGGGHVGRNEGIDFVVVGGNKRVDTVVAAAGGRGSWGCSGRAADGNGHRWWCLLATRRGWATALSHCGRPTLFTRWLIRRWKQHTARDSRGRRSVINCGGNNSICGRWVSPLVSSGRTDNGSRLNACRFACGWTDNDSRLNANLAICADTTTWREGGGKKDRVGEEGNSRALARAASCGDTADPWFKMG